MAHTNAADFVKENLKTIFAYALSRVSNKEDAEDLTNDIVVAILQSADKIKNADAFYGYIWAIAANTYKKFLQKRNRCQTEEIDDYMSDITDFTEKILEKEEMNILRREIALLTKEYRECTIAYYFDELSCVEISRKLNISLEMVKYYLFKTRKILKEGICMEREFGEKSFRPAPFEFITVFGGMYNEEYRNLFARKLPGQILLSTYYTPMSIRELAVELGVGSVYLEDEIALLEKYNLIKALTAAKYQANIMIFTDAFVKELYREAEKFAIPEIEKIITGMKGKIGELRKINSICEKLSDNHFLWGLLWPIMLRSHEEMIKSYPQFEAKNTIYGQATGVNFGFANTEFNKDFSCENFAGYSGIDEKYYAVAADFGILPEKNRYFKNADSGEIKEKIYKAIAGEMAPEFMILTKEQEQQVFMILKEEIFLMATFYEKMFSCVCKVMRNHAPRCIQDQIEHNVFQTFYFYTIGLIGGCAVKSKALALPEFDGPAAMYVREK